MAELLAKANLPWYNIDMEQKEITLNVQLSDFALKLRRLRMERGLSIDEVAGACNIRRDRLFRYETDKEIPSMQTILTLATFYAVDKDFLLDTSKKIELSTSFVDRKA